MFVELIFVLFLLSWPTVTLSFRFRRCFLYAIEFCFPTSVHALYHLPIKIIVAHLLSHFRNRCCCELIHLIPNNVYLCWFAKTLSPHTLCTSVFTHRAALRATFSLSHSFPRSLAIDENNSLRLLWYISCCWTGEMLSLSFLFLVNPAIFYGEYLTASLFAKDSKLESSSWVSWVYVFSLESTSSHSHSI